jgi:hypothetical protein
MLGMNRIIAEVVSPGIESTTNYFEWLSSPIFETIIRIFTILVIFILLYQITKMVIAYYKK